ncbi:hypothetical protein ACTQ5K_13420 [Niallia sp. Sow4_A1]|jgi:hypothetical protein|nr:MULTISPECIES: hypothetical protein [Bacillaceae]CAI9387171.1 hypothetical protein BACSP_01914 [Bacillus sp. T2.9-1]
MNILKKIFKKEQKNDCCNIMIEEVGEKQEGCCEGKEERKDERKA